MSFLFDFGNSSNIVQNELQEILNLMTKLVHLIFFKDYESDDRIKQSNEVITELTTAINKIYEKYISTLEKQLRVSNR